MITRKALNGKSYAGNPHVQFDEGEVASAATPRCGPLLYKMKIFGNIIRVARGVKNWLGGGVARMLAAATAIALAGTALAGTYNDGTYTWTYHDLPSGGVELFKASLVPAIDPIPTGEATKLKKYTVKVSGVVVNGVGYGIATSNRPPVSWTVTVK